MDITPCTAHGDMFIVLHFHFPPIIWTATVVIPSKLSFLITEQQRSEVRLILHSPALFALSDDNTSLRLEHNWFVFKAEDHINNCLWEELNTFWNSPSMFWLI